MPTLELTAKRPAPASRTPKKASAQSLLPRRGAARAQAETNLVNQYLPLVKTVVGRIQMTLPPHIDAEDLHSAGLIGLLDAIRHFNSHLGSNFESYARVRIRGAIFDELRRMDWVPRSVHRKARKVQLAVAGLEARLRRAPTSAELAVELKLPLAEFHHLLDEIRPATFLCLDAAISTESEDAPSLHEAFIDPRQPSPLLDVQRHETAARLAELLDCLPRAQKKVLALYYYEDLRLREIAEAFGLTESRICQIHAQAILALKALMEGRDIGQN